MSRIPKKLGATALVLVALVPRVSAQSPLSVVGPPPPVAPEVITRDDEGRATMRAFRVDTPLTIDGQLDEAVFSRIQPAGGFIQQEPVEGEPATEDTEVWVFFDDTNVYIAARCWDEHPERWVANELQRDGNITSNESLSVMFDTFYDRRNGFFFQTSPLGALRDQTFIDEGNQNSSWDTVWEVKSGRFEGGWTVEMAIPFKSLRYQESDPQLWGINFRRTVQWKNETSYLTQVPAAYSYWGPFKASVFATLVGMETPEASKNIEIKPYSVSTLATDHAATEPFSNDFSPSVGVDLKYGLTRSLTADFTVNTDFAQVEEDVQQVNLTRFNLRFPEKRDFFLEGQGIFAFGGVSVTGGGGGTADIPILFFSRRIGLSQGQAVPVLAGARVTGKTGRYSVGLLNIQTKDKPEAGAFATNFSVVRLKRDILRRSSVGFIATRRSPTIAGQDSNFEIGFDANLSFFENVTLNSYYARTNTPGREGDQSSYRGSFNYAADRYGLLLERVMVGEGFNPELGFTRRTDFARSTAQARFSPRPTASQRIRKLTWQGNYDYITNAAGNVIENRAAEGTFRIEFNNSDSWTTTYTHVLEYLPEGFEIASDIVLPVGGYSYQFVRTEYGFGRQRRANGRVYASRGTFYDGHRTELGYSRGLVTLSSLLSIEPEVTLNWVDLPQGSFQDQLLTARVVVTPSPRMVISSLIQRSATTENLSSSVRFQWEYIPGSDLFIVYSDGRDTSAPGFPALQNRSFTVKITRLLRF